MTDKTYGGHIEAIDEKDRIFMQRALELAEQAAAEDEVPVGAVIVKDDQIIAEAFNQKEASHLCTHHAEIMAIETASKALGNWRLEGCTLYVTLEPCVMCAGAIVSARLDRLVFATEDPKAGAVVSLYNILEDQRLNHQPLVHFGVLKQPCSELLKAFFKQKRVLKKNLKV